MRMIGLLRYWKADNFFSVVLQYLVWSFTDFFFFFFLSATAPFWSHLKFYVKSKLLVDIDFFFFFWFMCSKILVFEKL